MLKIRQLSKSEIPLLKNFPPEDWNLDLPALLSFHFNHSYFYPIVAEIKNKIAGCGNGCIHGKIGWLGNIIVAPDYREQGIGTELTRHLIKYLSDQGCATQLLVASEMGEPVYRNLGFKISSSYILYKRESAAAFQNNSNVRIIRKEDISQIKKLDKEITGEERFAFIERFLPTAWVYAAGKSGNISGVYFPDYSNGLIMATDIDTGLELMKFRLSRGWTNAIIPEANTSARDFLLKHNFKEYRRAPRMILGTEVQWQPTRTYNRGSGYCG